MAGKKKVAAPSLHEYIKEHFTRHPRPVEIVYKALAELVREAYKNDTRLPQTPQIAKRVGRSARSVADALQRLREDGSVVRTPYGRGYFYIPNTPEFMGEDND